MARYYIPLLVTLCTLFTPAFSSFANSSLPRYNSSCFMPWEDSSTLWFAECAFLPFKNQPGNPHDRYTLYWTPDLDKHVMHFGVRLLGDCRGFVGFGFPQQAGSMVPSNAVIALANMTTGTVKVKDFVMTEHAVPHLPGTQHLTDTRGVFLPEKGGSIVFKFTRPLVVGNGTMPIVMDGTNIIYSFRHSEEMGFHNGGFQAGRIDFVRARVDVNGDDWKRTHGLGMWLALGVFMPLAVLFTSTPARGALGPLWFRLHMGLQLCSAATVFVMFTVAIKHHSLNSGHGRLGTTIVASCALQVIFGLMRPAIDSPTRGRWRMLHRGLAVLILVMATINFRLGVDKYVGPRFFLVEHKAVTLAVPSVLLALAAAVVVHRALTEEKARDGDDTSMAKLLDSA